MAASPFVVAATAENFSPLVLDNSRRGLVVVHFWSPRAAPCQLLNPRLVALAEAYGGRFLLVLANVDKLAATARHWGVASVPTVKFFRNREVVHTIHGAESEGSLRASLDAFLPGPAERVLVDALRLAEAGDTEGAYARLAQAALDDPDNPRLPLELARLMVRHGDVERAHGLLSLLPPRLAADPAIESLTTHLTLILTAWDAPALDELDARLQTHPEDREARWQRAARRLLADEFEPALDDLLALAALEPAWRAGLPRRALLAVIALPAVDAERAKYWRGRLAEVLHR